MNEFSVRKLSKVVYGDEEVVSKYRMLRLHSGTDRPFNLFPGAHKSHTECSAVRYGGGGTELPNAAPFHYLFKGLHLCDAAIHEQFYSRDSSDARDHGLGDLIGVPNLPNGTVLEI